MLDLPAYSVNEIHQFLPTHIHRLLTLTDRWGTTIKRHMISSPNQSVSLKSYETLVHEICMAMEWSAKKKKKLCGEIIDPNNIV